MKKIICLTAILSLVLVCMFSSCSKSDKDGEFKDVSIEVLPNFGKKYNPEFILYIGGKEEDLIIDKSEWDSYEYSNNLGLATLRLKKKSIADITFNFKVRNSMVNLRISSRKNDYEYENMDVLLNIRVNGVVKAQKDIEGVSNSGYIIHID